MPRRRGQPPQEVFLSHASADRLVADALARTLRSHGDILGAQQWHDEIGRALQRCDWFVLLLSPASVRSKWVKRELLFALNAKRYEDRIVPLLEANCEWQKLSLTLDALQIVRFDRSFPSGCRELLGIWGIGFDPSRVAAPRRKPPSRKRKA